MKPMCGKTIKTAISGIALMAVVFTLINVLMALRNFSFGCKQLGSHCSLAMWLLVFFFSLFCGVIFGVKRHRLIRLCFPVACGHNKCIFTGRSSKSLRDILLSVDAKIPSEEELEEFRDKTLLYLNDIRAEFEKTMPATFQFIFSGSTIERYGVPIMLSSKSTDRSCTARSSNETLRTDLDVMFCSVADSASFSGQGNILVEPLAGSDASFRGYAKLTSLTPGKEGRCISSKHIRELVKNAVGNTRVLYLPSVPCCCGASECASQIKLKTKGPAIKITLEQVFEADITLCFHCTEWPTMSDWPSRPRYWPSLVDAQRIMSLGCHLVAKPAPNDEDQKSWRFSFSLAEVELSKLVPDTARKCFVALKIILKDHLQPVVPELGSYHIKTIFLNTLEKVPVGFWVEDNIEECFLTLLSELHYALQAMNCPHHWFNFINLFDIKKKQLTLLANKVELIMKFPSPFIFDDGCCCFTLCCSSAPGYNFNSRTSQQFLNEYTEDIIVVSRDGNPRVIDSETRPFQLPTSLSEIPEVVSDPETYDEPAARLGELVVSLPPVLSIASSQMSDIRSDQYPYQETMARPEQLVVSLPPVDSIPSSQISDVRSDQHPYQGAMERPEELVVSLPPLLSIPSSQMSDIRSDQHPYQEAMETPEKNVVSLPPVVSIRLSQMPKVSSDQDPCQELPPTELRSRLFSDEPFVESFTEEIPLTVVLPPIPDA